MIQKLECLEPNTVKLLILEECLIFDSDIQKICKLLSSQQSTEVITIDKNIFDADSTATLLSYVKHLENLVHFSPSNTLALDTCMDAFTSSLCNKEQLTELCLDGCKLNLACWEKLVEALKDLKSLRHLSLNDTNTLDCRVETLGLALMERHEIGMFSLNKNSISDIGLRGLVPLFKGEHCVRQLWLEDNQISDYGFPVICEITELAAVGFQLNLGGNQIGTKGAEMLVELWSASSTLGNLDITNNQIDERKIQIKGLKNVQLYGNTLGDTRRHIICERITNNESFRILILNDIGLTDDGLKVLEKVICRDGKLEVFEIMDNKLTQNSITSLTNIYHNCPHLKSINTKGNEGLDFEVSDIKRKGLDQYPFVLSGTFAEWWLENNKDVLLLKYHEIIQQDMQVLCNILKENSLKIINMNGCMFGEENSETLFKCWGLLKNHLRYVDLSQNMITDAALGHLASVYKCQKSTVTRLGSKVKSVIRKEAKSSESVLQRLDLENNEIEDKGVVSLSEAVSCNHFLVYLSIRGNAVSSAGSKALGKILKEQCSLQYLSLKDNKVGDEGVQHIAHGLKFNQKLLELDLSGNGITLQGLGYIGTMLKDNKHLSSLDLSCNRIDMTDITFVKDSFSTGLAENTCLKTLVMADNNISDNGASILAEVLSKQNKTLTQLNLASIGFGKKGLLKLGDLLRATKNLVHINISRNRQLGRADPNIAALCYGLALNKTLEFLGIGQVGIKNDAIKGLADAIGKNRFLDMVDVTGNNISAEELARQVRQNKGHCKMIFDNFDCADYLDKKLYSPFPEAVAEE